MQAPIASWLSYGDNPGRGRRAVPTAATPDRLKTRVTIRNLRWPGKRPRLPVGGGDAIVIWPTKVGLYVLFGVLLVVPVLALVFGYMTVSTSAGRIGVVAGMGALIALLLSGLIAAVTSPSRIEVSSGMIVYITAADNTMTLYRESGNALRIVRAGSP